LRGISEYEIFKFRLELDKSSFLRIPDQGPGQAQESSPFKIFWIPAFAGMTKLGYLSKDAIASFHCAQTAA
jgi:hypothetical protein